MVLEYAAGGELFDLIARRERVSKLQNHTIGYDLYLFSYYPSYIVN